MYENKCSPPEKHIFIENACLVALFTKFQLLMKKPSCGLLLAHWRRLRRVQVCANRRRGVEVLLQQLHKLALQPLRVVELHLFGNLNLMLINLGARPLKGTLKGEKSNSAPYLLAPLNKSLPKMRQIHFFIFEK